MAVTVTHTKVLSAPSTGADDKVYGADYVDPASHSIAGLGTMAEQDASNVTITGGSITGVTGVGTGTVTTVSVVTANGVSGSVADPTTTPAITIVLGAIAPTSVAASGTVTGSNLSGSNTGDQTSVSGNAGTATALQTGRTIDGVTFDGTQNITVIAPGTHAASSKATPVDADELALVDSAASNVLKRLTWANLKATLAASPSGLTVGKALAISNGMPLP